MSHLTDQQLLELAISYHRAGRIADAETLYRQLAAAYPGHAALQHEIGVLAFQSGRLAVARPFFAQAVTLDPQRSDYWNNYGLLLQELGELDAAAASYETAIRLQPDLGLGHYNLGNVRLRQKQWNAAISHFQQSLIFLPDYVESFLNLALAYSGSGRIPEAIEVLRAATARLPHDGRLWNNLGNLLANRYDFTAALAAHRRALQCDPNSPAWRHNLGVTLKDVGSIGEAIACFRTGLAMDPAQAQIHSSLILTLHLDPASTPATIATECERWQTRHALPFRAWRQPFSHDRDPHRPLRIGYVSPDFREHPVGRQLLPLVRAHDRGAVSVMCYSDVSSADSLTEKFQALGWDWHDTSAWTDEQLANRVHADRIDILVDLALHTAWNRLRVFARKPAPVQASFAGYPGGTGLEAIDYRLTDRFLELPESTIPRPAGRPIHLPDSFWCFDPPDESPPVNELPALSAGHIVFGCLHAFSKVNERVLTLWSRVLLNTPGSRLRMLCPPGESRDRTLHLFGQLGIGKERVEFVAFLPRPDFLAEHHRLDLILDTFPYNGHVTTCDALWMGVPVISLAGQLPVARGGLSILSTVGLPELVANSEEEYVRIAVTLAQDFARLATLRATMRARMQSSPLMDAGRFARGVEAAYRTMWHRWCAA
jgi:predicted O-linked N-acetylglucosamine transferase (SPINDLY family)